MSEIITKVSTDILQIHPRNTEFYDDITGEDYERFKGSIRDNGLLSPILVSPDMTVISGHQRLKACKELGIKLVPVMIKEDLTDENEKLKLLLVANFGRTKNDEAKQRKIVVEYVNLCGYKHGGERGAKGDNRLLVSQAEIAKQLGVSERTLHEMLAIERKLTPEVKQLLKDGVFTKTTASKVLVKLSPQEQAELIAALPQDVINTLTQKQVQSYVDQIKTKDNKISGYEMMMEEYQNQIADLREQIKSIEKTDLNEQESKYEIERLKKKIADLIFEKNELENKHTETVVQTVEVDRQETLKKIEDLEKQLKSTDEINANLSKQIIEDAEKLSKFMGTDTNYKLVSHCSDITMRITDFLKEMSQLDYMAESFNEIPIATRREYKRCITSVKKWVDRILEVIDMEENVVDYEVIND